MKIDVELLKHICKRYGAKLEENKSGGFIFDNKGIEVQFSNEEMKKVLEKIEKCSYTFQRVFDNKAPLNQILDEINKQELILKDLRKKYPNLLFQFLDNEWMVYYLVFKPRDKNKVDKYKYSSTTDIYTPFYEAIEKYLTEEEFDEIIVLYDILGRIKGD